MCVILGKAKHILNLVSTLIPHGHCDFQFNVMDWSQCAADISYFGLIGQKWTDITAPNMNENKCKTLFQVKHLGESVRFDI